MSDLCHHETIMFQKKDGGMNSSQSSNANSITIVTTPSEEMDASVVVGDEGVVVGCKCMGKCRSAPNVKLSNPVGGVGESFGDDSMRTPSNPLYIGVGLEDVELIVSSYFESDTSAHSRRTC
ncbi:hypothetical protein RND81_11G075400 [Saponaria officinalis]|uniref:Uncharacterized protein n=1 Tax=Saponaria officinalis TaxID=3572 RepID=A0AAW1HJ27_SAPOF